MTGRRVLFLCAVLSLFLAPGRAADRVVLVVWDGLRPDLVSQVNTPVLMQLAKEGVFFAHHHPVYPSSTEVNGTALATGDFPDHTTILANREYRPAIDPLASVPTEGAATIAKGDALTGGKYLPVPTVAETLHTWGFPTAVAGTKGVARLADRAPEAERTGPAKASALLAAGGRDSRRAPPRSRRAPRPLPGHPDLPQRRRGPLDHPRPDRGAVEGRGAEVLRPLAERPRLLPAPQRPRRGRGALPASAPATRTWAASSPRWRRRGCATPPTSWSSPTTASPPRTRRSTSPPT